VLVEEGDTVSRGTALFIIGDKGATLGYQIQYNDEYVNPEDMIEING
jgi:murein DD-endopeptidase MepM/ murein hydrolase activator NlpD